MLVRVDMKPFLFFAYCEWNSWAEQATAHYLILREEIMMLWPRLELQQSNFSFQMIKHLIFFNWCPHIIGLGLVVLHFSISKEVVILHKDVNVDCCNPTATPQSINQQDHLTFTSSFPWLEDIDDVTPQLNCTRRLSPKRLPKKKNEFPIVVMALKETQR